MKRRDFITLLGGAVAWPVAASAQEKGRIYRLGSLFGAPRGAPFHIAFFEGLQRFGFIEGQNLVADPDGYGLRAEQLADHASEVVKGGVDVIVCSGDAAIHAAQQATKTIPILAATDDMIGSRFVGSLAKPDANITGVSMLSDELDGKRQEILMEALPGVRRMAALADDRDRPRHLQILQNAASARGVELSVYQVAKPEEIAGAIEVANSAGAAALNVLGSLLLFSSRRIIYRSVATLSLPAIFQSPEMAEEDGFIAYGSSLVKIYRDMLPRQLAALLRGAKVSDVPVEQPTEFELVINLRTAKALGLSIPEAFLLQADKIIE
jgi:putative tryptophan/tyrosine transport system substrate-binding protein